MGSLWGKKAEPTDESADKAKKNFEGIKGSEEF
jgi:hypothetical protein